MPYSAKGRGEGVVVAMWRRSSRTRSRSQPTGPFPGSEFSRQKRGRAAARGGGSEFQEERRADQHIRGGDVRGQRNVADVADSEQRLDIGIVRMLVERVHHEEDRVDLALDHAAGDLDVATVRPSRHPLDVESDLVAQQVARRPRGNDVVLLQTTAVERCKRDQVCLLAVMSNDGETRPLTIRG